jgi:DNA helicase HerA-like ATPase
MQKRPVAFRWPRTDQHSAIIGMNGSGKSVFAAHALSYAPFNHMPYVLIDYKDEELFNAIDRAHYIDFTDKPKSPGIYILKAQPEKDDARVNDFLYGVLKRGRTGLIYDEGYSIPKGAMETIYMQGRSKHIPVMTLTQRPSWLTRYAFTEASFYAVFRLNDKRDKDTLRSWVPANDPVWDLETRLPEYHCRWYDSKQDASFVLKPAPDPELILERFDDKLKVKREVF